MKLTKSIRILNGYRIVYKPEHPRAMKCKNWKGYVYEHVVIAEKFLNRALRDNEVVHHLNSDRSDNREKNLLVLERSQHGKLHAWLNENTQFNENRTGDVNSIKSNIKKCVICDNYLNHKQKLTCSNKCRGIFRQTVDRPDAVTLQQDLTDGLSILAIGKKYGVSDNAIRKWLKQYNIPITKRFKAVISDVTQLVV